MVFNFVSSFISVYRRNYSISFHLGMLLPLIYGLQYLVLILPSRLLIFSIVDLLLNYFSVTYFVIALFLFFIYVWFRSLTFLNYI